VYFFSYGPKDSVSLHSIGTHASSQVWMLGVGRQTGWGIEVDELLMPTGGGFAGDFDASQVDYKPIGSLTFVYPSCGDSSQRGQLSIRPTGDAGTTFQAVESDNYVQLSLLIDCITDERGPYTHRTGSLFNPSKPGEGIIVQGLNDGRGVVQWMTFDNTGAQMWIQGIGQFDEYGVLIVSDLKTYGGTFWGPDFDPNEITDSSFGSLTIWFIGCEFAQITYDTADFGSGQLDFNMPTFPLHINDAGAGCWDY